jgi:hypothetical protein
LRRSWPYQRLFGSMGGMGEQSRRCRLGNDQVGIAEGPLSPDLTGLTLSVVGQCLEAKYCTRLQVMIKYRKYNSTSDAPFELAFRRFFRRNVPLSIHDTKKNSDRCLKDTTAMFDNGIETLSWR